MRPFSFKGLLRPHLRKLKPYSSARSEFSGKARVFLDANENPEDTEFNRYPDPLQSEIKTLLSGIKRTATENIFIGNGSDEAIDLLMRAFCRPGKDNIVIADPTYGMYEVSAAIHDIEVKRVELRKDFELDTNAMLEACTRNTRIIFVCSPNNPTGNIAGKRNIKRLLKKFNGIVVVDEAYIDFCPEESLLPELKGHPNLVVLQTLSKAWGLAGLRLGMCFGAPELIGILNAIKPPYNISQAAQTEVIHRLRKGTKAMEASVQAILKERARLETEFRNMNLKVFPSQSNFLLVRFPDSTLIFEELRSRGIIVRDRSRETNCSNCLRITVGTTKENTALLRAIRNILNTISN